MVRSPDDDSTTSAETNDVVKSEPDSVAPFFRCNVGLSSQLRLFLRMEPMGKRSAFVVANALLCAAGIAASQAAGGGAEWKIAGRCAAQEAASPGQGLFEVRYQAHGGDFKALEIRGCGKNRAFRKYWKWGGDEIPLKIYALPFFKKGQLDFLIELGWDDGVSYSLLAADKNYDVAVRFDSVEGVYFNDQDNDGRWEILVLGVESFTCANGVRWARELVAAHWEKLVADSLCKTASK